LGYAVHLHFVFPFRVVEQLPGGDELVSQLVSLLFEGRGGGQCGVVFFAKSLDLVLRLDVFAIQFSLDRHLVDVVFLELPDHSLPVTGLVFQFLQLDRRRF
jgi:hypothetical protein